MQEVWGFGPGKGDRLVGGRVVKWQADPRKDRPFQEHGRGPGARPQAKEGRDKAPSRKDPRGTHARGVLEEAIFRMDQGAQSLLEGKETPVGEERLSNFLCLVWEVVIFEPFDKKVSQNMSYPLVFPVRFSGEN